MTNWEQWFREHHRKEIICATVDYNGTGRCDKNCILYGVCKKDGYLNTEELYRACDEFLDSEACMSQEAVVTNLATIRDAAERSGFDGYVKTLNRAIELLKEVNE